MNASIEMRFSESDPEFQVDPTLVEKLRAEISDDEYEAKVVKLLPRAWKCDVAIDSNSERQYREALTTLSQGDHYLLIMIGRALRKELRPWWAFWR